mgnify:CR=1 FL=1
MKKVLFIDRDGTILREPLDEQVDSLEDFEFIPGVITALSAIAKETDYELVMVSNQDGLGTAMSRPATFDLRVEVPAYGAIAYEIAPTSGAAH